jgi:DNA-binding XRE family transcriptional regulator
MEAQDEPNKGGRPTKYKEAFNDQVFEMALLGLSDSQMANILGITEQTLNNWKTEHPMFFESLTQGKENADGKVARAMYKRALGLTIIEEALTKDGQVVQLRKELPPDTPAAKHWLANRQRKLWANNGESTFNTTEPLIIIRTEGDKDE